MLSFENAVTVGRAYNLRTVAGYIPAPHYFVSIWEELFPTKPFPTNVLVNIYKPLTIPEKDEE